MIREQTAASHFLKKHLGSKLKITPLSGDSGERSYFRVKNLRGSFIFVHDSSPKSFSQFVKMGSLLEKKKVPKPKVFHILDEKGWLILEDLGDESLEQWYLKTKKLDHHKKALKQLAQFQNNTSKKHFNNKFTKDKSLNELLFSFQQWDAPITDAQKNLLFEDFTKLSRDIAKIELRVGHGDFHSRNLFIHRGFVHWIDFQDAGLYPAGYDLLSLIHDSYLDLSKAQQKELTQYFKKEGGIFNETSEPLIYAERGFKAAGCFMSFYLKRTQKSHLSYIEPTLEKTKASLIKLKKFPHFLNYVEELLHQLKSSKGF